MRKTKFFFYFLFFVCSYTGVNAQSWYNKSGKNSVTLSSSVGAAIPVDDNGYKYGIGGTVSLNYNTKPISLNIIWGYNFFYKPKTSNNSVNLAMNYTYGIGASKRFLKSKKLFLSADIFYNEAEQVISFLKNPVYSGFGFGLSSGYSIFEFKKGVISISANYNSSIFSHINFSNAGVKIHYSIPLSKVDSSK
jgi:hypothetical protein